MYKHRIVIGFIMYQPFVQHFWWHISAQVSFNIKVMISNGWHKHTRYLLVDFFLFEGAHATYLFTLVSLVHMIQFTCNLFTMVYDDPMQSSKENIIQCQNVRRNSSKYLEPAILWRLTFYFQIISKIIIIIYALSILISDNYPILSSLIGIFQGGTIFNFGISKVGADTSVTNDTKTSSNKLSFGGLFSSKRNAEKDEQMRDLYTLGGQMNSY